MDRSNSAVNVMQPLDRNDLQPTLRASLGTPGTFR